MSKHHDVFRRIKLAKQALRYADGDMTKRQARAVIREARKAIKHADKQAGAVTDLDRYRDGRALAATNDGYSL